MRVYVIDTTNLDKGFEEMSQEEFMTESERQGRVYSIHGFQRAFNEEEVNVNTDVILIK
jgi:hypothetical protein